MLQFSYPTALREPLLERRQSQSINWLSTFHCFIFPAVAAYLFGYDIGASPTAVRSLISPDTSGTNWWDLTPTQISLVQNGSTLGAIAVSVILLLAGNRWGRRAELVCAAVCHFIGALGVFASGAPWQLLGWRLMSGAGMGLSLHAGAIYIAETCPASVRGFLICLKEAFLVIGMLMGYLVSFALRNQVGGWRSTFLAAAPAALLLLSGATHLPESPRWLMLQAWQPDVLQVWLQTSGQVPIPWTPGYQAARAALMRARGRMSNELLETELSGIAASVREARLADASPLRLFLHPMYYRPLMAGLSLVLLTQVTGEPAVMYFGAGILRDAGVLIGQEELIGGLRLLMTVVAAANVDIWGRRPMLLFGASGMTLSLIVLAVAQLDWAPLYLGGDFGVAIMSVTALLLFVCCYQVSLGPLIWVALTEMFPLAIRGPAIAAANTGGMTSSLLVTAALPPLTKYVGSLGTYCTFASMSLFSLCVVWSVVPELRGKSLEEVEATWGSLPSFPGFRLSGGGRGGGGGGPSASGGGYQYRQQLASVSEGGEGQEASTSPPTSGSNHHISPGGEVLPLSGPQDPEGEVLPPGGVFEGGSRESRSSYVSHASLGSHISSVVINTGQWGSGTASDGQSPPGQGGGGTPRNTSPPPHIVLV